ncbi:hypothetical protein [Streptomyces albidocamelliae]|uniref:Uncharacterized protein n=1 Tax=Streptomyces albidocamelliae TaxID=2981135 RepID=A0ABY6F1D2_9ACTN|nr:hypothetical protein [Streptomyces sp. HUAS 14-6]UXY40434.1 hypothetical protein N8I86_38360 [Streptomyces sp. HUAS 14-6]
MKAVNVWDFAEQDLPDGAGPGVWTCARADTWRGPGEVAVALRTAGAGTGEQARVVARARATGACGRFGQHVVVHANWRSPKGAWYVLAAGSRAVRGLIVTGDVTAGTDGATLAVRAGARARTAVRARLAGVCGPSTCRRDGPGSRGVCRPSAPRPGRRGGAVRPA